MLTAGAEVTVDLGAGRVGVLDRVVQQRRGDGCVVELELGEDRGDLQRVGEVGVAGGPHLLAMRPHGIDIGAVEQVFVGGGIVVLHPVDQVVLPHQQRFTRLRSRKVISKLKVYAGPEHPHAAQQPQPYDITQIAQ